MYVKPMGIATREITMDSVALNANVRSPTWVFLGSSPLADARYNNTAEEPTRKRMNVPTEQKRTFRRLCVLPLSIDNSFRASRRVVGRYLGKLVPRSALTS